MTTDSTAVKECTEISKFRIIDDKGLAFPYIEIKVNGDWKTFNITKSAVGIFKFDYQEMEINGLNSKALILKWSNSVYGSGGGTNTEGFQIWDLENATKLFDEITYCSEESFGRNGNRYLLSCQKKIKIKNKNIKVYKSTCSIEGNSQNDEIKTLMENCNLSELEPDIYIFRNKQLTKK